MSEQLWIGELVIQGEAVREEGSERGKDRGI